MDTGKVDRGQTFSYVFGVDESDDTNPLGDGELRDGNLRPWSSSAPFPVWVPEPPCLDGGELVWRTNEGIIGIGPRLPEPGLLVEFLGLSEFPDARIREFAERWGWLDSQALAEDDEFLMLPDYWPRPGQLLPWVMSDWPNGEYREAIASWRERSGQARALVSVAASLHRGELGNLEDWHCLYPAWTADKSLWVRRSEMPLAPEQRSLWRREDRTRARMHMRECLNRWLLKADVRPKLLIAYSETESVALGGHGLLGALAVQLLYTICRTQGLATCSYCGSAFDPKRRPTAGRRCYCKACREGGAPVRDATRACAQRRAEAYRLHLLGTSIPDIARQLKRAPKVIKGWILRERRSGGPKSRRW